MQHEKRKQTGQLKPAERQLKFPDYLMFASIDIKVNRFKVPGGFAWNSIPHVQVLLIPRVIYSLDNCFVYGNMIWPYDQRAQ